MMDLILYLYEKAKNIISTGAPLSGIIETGFLFYVAGANVLVVTLGRLLFAFLVTMLAARLPHFRNMTD